MIARTLAVFSLCMACFPPIAAGAIYKYVDPQGRQHFADQPKQGWTRVDVRTSVVETTTGTDAPTESREQAVSRAADCARLQEQLRTYRNASRVVERDALGREKEYSAEERTRLIEKYEQDVQACSQPPPAQADDSIE